MDSKEDLKVLHVSTPLSWRGGEQQVFNLMVELKKKDVVQSIFCPVGSELGKRLKEFELPVIAFKKRGGFGLLAAMKFNRMVRKEGFNLIHAHDAQAHTLCVLATILFGLKIPVVLHRRVDFEIKQRWFTRLKYNHEQIKRIVCVSDAIRTIVAAGISHPERIVTIHSGIDVSLFAASEKGKLRNLLKLKAETTLIGNVAALADHKDYPTFLRTAEILLQTNPDIRFVIMGDGPLKNNLVQLTEEMGLTEKVFFTGFRSNVYELLPDFDVFLFTSKTEGLGTSVLDAFAAGVPVVACNAGGIPELVIHEKTGLLSEVGNAVGLAKQVLRIIEDKNLANTLKANAGEHLKNFSKEQTAQKTIALYQEVLSENR